jgi:arylsulfatase A-like enzyme
MKNYAAMVTKADDQIGQLLSLLNELALDEDTIVFVTSDNGGTRGASSVFNCNGPLRGYKGDLYEGGIRVPMIVRWSGKTDAGRVCNVPWYFADFLPTAAEVSGLQAPGDIDGKSVLPTIIGSSQPVHEHLYWEQNVHSRQTLSIVPERLQQAVRKGDWKAVMPAPDQPLELYNLAEDIGETTDVADAEPTVVAEIRDYLATARTEPGPHLGGAYQFATE